MGLNPKNGDGNKKDKIGSQIGLNTSRQGSAFADQPEFLLHGKSNWCEALSTIVGKICKQRGASPVDYNLKLPSN
ncbi:hypothetical protein BGAL_0768g00030 [Botrytis galanthina]|uniref:Uncharacterized protein n=1 Tax=Botrytis galanthina TaxID=278940 RepID=A0A4S8QRC4_9HELO|nr:hypothetical protein BGAL_0768g00030 [Botrytis galanthina]